MAIASIFNQGIEERVATFETRRQTANAVVRRLESGEPLLVAERGEEVVGWAAVSPYCERHHYYADVGEATVYVARKDRRTGAGRALLTALATAAAEGGLHKLTGKIFTANTASIGLVGACGWREVGVHRRHGRLDGGWRDVLVVELLLADEPD